MTLSRDKISSVCPRQLENSPRENRTVHERWKETGETGGRKNIEKKERKKLQQMERVSDENNGPSSARFQSERKVPPEK